MGQTIVLGGNQRRINHVDILLGGNIVTPFQIKFYDLDGASGEPQTVLWESEVLDYPWTPPYYNRKYVSIDVPNVVTPDSFALMVANLTRENAGRMSIEHGHDVEIGTPGAFWKRPFDSENILSLPLGLQITMTIYAIPEPTSAILAMIAAVTIPLTRRAR